MPKVLIAEDDKFLLKAYRVKLDKSEFEVRYATDGEEVLEILKSFRPDIIVLDLILPKHDGFYVLEQLRKNDEWKDIPVLVTSNLGQKEDIDRAKTLGAKEYIIKSDMSLTDLVAKISSVITGH